MNYYSCWTIRGRLDEKLMSWDETTWLKDAYNMTMSAIPNSCTEGHVEGCGVPVFMEFFFLFLF